MGSDDVVTEIQVNSDEPRTEFGVAAEPVSTTQGINNIKRQIDIIITFYV